MSVRSSKAEPQKQQVPPAVIVIAVVVLLAFVVWRGWAAFTMPQGKLPPPPTQDINFLEQKARECQGDFSKLSPADQQKVQQISHGFGPAAMASDWRKESQPSQH
ncbi:MAG TPA: hypothetical protein VFA07_08695 [Chthonomonadaceae bacterium]|nr:hypothetical protein [Chthonomonadaceae bacterium]